MPANQQQKQAALTSGRQRSDSASVEVEDGQDENSPPAGPSQPMFFNPAAFPAQPAPSAQRRGGARAGPQRRSFQAGPAPPSG